MSQTRFQFDPFELDVRAGELRKAGRRVRLQDKSLKVLEALVEQPGEVVTRDELRARLWPPHIIVDFDNGLNNAINKLRGVLGDSAEEPRYIETVGRRGYRFIGVLSGGAAAVIEQTTALPTTDAHEKRLFRAKPLGIVLAAVLAAAALLTIVWRYAAVESPAAPHIRSLAVLPLENLSSDPEQEYFSDGMTDALISQLAGIRALRVISRQSVMQFKRSPTPMPRIARELKVDGIVEGTVLRTANRVRVSVQLIHAPTDRHIWSAQYERPLDDVMALQAEIARHVAEEVRATVTPQETARLAGTKPVDAQAYDLYLRGRYFWRQRTEQGLRKSLEYYQQALAIAPEFALAHAAMAESYGPLGYYGMMPPDQATPKMKAAALQALELDPELVEGLNALAACAAFHEWRLAAAEQYFRRALAINPNYATTLGWYGQFLENTDRQAENLAARRRAFELEPLAPGFGVALGRALFLNGRADEGIAMLRRTLELDPDSPLVHHYLGWTYEAIGNHPEAIEAFTRAGDDGGLGHAYGVAGRERDARIVLARLERASRERYVPPFFFALVHVGLGEKSAALDFLEQGYATRDVAMSGIKVDPRFAPLAEEPRFQALLDKMGLRRREQL